MRLTATDTAVKEEGDCGGRMGGAQAKCEGRMIVEEREGETKEVCVREGVKGRCGKRCDRWKTSRGSSLL